MAGSESYNGDPVSESGLQSVKGGNQQFPDVRSEQATAAERKKWGEAVCWIVLSRHF